jgi:hypothetical protein
LGLFIGLFAVFFNPAYLFHEKIKGDDASYVAHSFTIALDGDLNYCNEIGFDQKGCSEGLSRTAPPHPIGTGIVHAPMVKLFSFIDNLQDHPVLKDRQAYVGSWSFLGMFVSTTCCFIFGLLLFIRAIESLSSSIPRWLVLLFAFGYGVPYYVFQRFTMSHGPEFFFLALVFWSTIKLMTAYGKQKYLLLFILPVAIGMSYLIRPANINVLVACPLIFLLASRITGHKGLRIRSPMDWICIVSAVLLVAGVVVALNKNLYGVYFPDSEQMYGRAIRRIPITLGNKAAELFSSLKYIPKLLFTSEFGLIFSAPVLVFGALAALIFGVDKRHLLVTAFYLCCFLIFFGVPLAVVLFWKNTGDAYGYRYLFSIAPVCIMGLVLFFHRYSGTRFKIAKRGFLALIAFAMLGQIFFATSTALSPSKRINAFGREEKFSSLGYERSLLKSATEVNGWGNMMAKRYPGFLLVQMLDESQVRQMAQKLKLPADKFEEVFRNIHESSVAYRFCITVYGLLIPIIFWYLVCYRQRVAG